MERETFSSFRDFVPSNENLKINAKESQKTSEEYEEIVETFVTIPPDGGWGWVVVFGSFLVFFVGDGTLIAYGLFLEDMSRDLGCTSIQVTIPSAIISGVSCAFGPFAASLVNNFGYRVVGITGGILSMISFLLTSISSTIGLIHFTYGVVGGVGFEMMFMPATIAVGFYFEKWRGFATGISSCGTGIGGITMPLILTTLLNRLGWRVTFRILSGFIVLSLFGCLLFKPLKPTKITKVKLTTPISGNFFNTYHNKMYPTLSEVTEVPTVTLLQPRKLNKSSEVVMITYPTSKDGTGEESTKYSQTGSDYSRATTHQSKPSRHSTHKGLFSSKFGAKKKRKKMPLREIKTRPMYRDDIFLNSSFSIMDKYRTKSSSQKTSRAVVSKSEYRSNVDYHMSVTRVATNRDLQQSKCNFCSEAIKRTLATMLDYKLLKSPSFLLISFNAGFIAIGYFTPYFYIKERAVQNGISDNTSFWLISIIGVANTVGRIASGVIVTIPKVNCAMFCVGCFVVGGCVTILSSYFVQGTMQVLYAFLYGFFVAGISSIRTLLIVETLGLEKLTNSIGLILLFQGMASLLGILMAGVLKKATNGYEWPFTLAGVSIILGGLCLVPLRYVSRWENLNRQQK